MSTPESISVTVTGTLVGLGEELESGLPTAIISLDEPLEGPQALSEEETDEEEEDPDDMDLSDRWKYLYVRVPRALLRRLGPALYEPVEVVIRTTAPSADPSSSAPTES